MHYSSLRRFTWLLYWLFLTASFSVIGFLLVAAATGYKYNSHLSRWQKTGMLIVNVNPRDEILTFDGLEYPVSKSLRLPNILPGTYRVKVSKTDYLDWEDTITIKPGFVTSLRDPELFLAKPERVTLTDRAVSLLEGRLPADDRLRITDNELWFKTHLISRFSDTPSNALLLPGERYLVYAQAKQIHVIDIDGGHDQQLYERINSGPTPLALQDDQTLLFNDQEGIVALKFQ